MIIFQLDCAIAQAEQQVKMTATDQKVLIIIWNHFDVIITS